MIVSRKHAANQRQALTQASLKSLAAAGIALGTAQVAWAADTYPANTASTDAATDQQTAAKTLDAVHVRGLRDTSASNKYSQALQNTPQTVQVIGRELIREQGATTLSEALRNSAGVGTFYAGENGNTSTGDTISMRGFDTSNSIFLDGIRDVGSISRDVFNVEQIEVVKGPAGTDTGRAAPTGSINLITKQARLKNALYGSVSVGTDNQKRVTTDWSRKLGKTSAMRINAMWQDSDVPGRDHVNNKRWAIAPSFAVGLGTSTRVYLNLFHMQQDNVPDGYVPTIGLPGWTPQPGLEALTGHPVGSSNFYGTRSDHDTVRAQMATLRFEHDLGESVTLTNTTRWSRTQQDYLLTAFMSTGGTVANPLAGNIRWTDANDLASYTLNRSHPTFKDQRNGLLANQLNLGADFATGAVQHALSAGLEWTRETQDFRAQGAANGSSWTPANLYNPDWNATGLVSTYTGAENHGKTTTTSLYVFDTLTFSDKFLITGGVRADRYKTAFKTSVVCSATRAPLCGSLPAGTVFDYPEVEISDTLINYKLGAVYKPSEALSVYANYAISHQPPGGANFSLSTANNSLDNPSMEPQKARTFEVGAKWRLMDGRLGLDAALFRTDVTNEINTQVLDANGNPTQTGEKQVKGIELSLFGNLSENWTVSAGYTHQNAEVTEGAAVSADGSPNLSYTPGDGFTVWTSYKLPFGLTIGGGARHMGGLHRGTDGAVGTPAYTESYTVFDAVAAMPISRNLDLRLNAYNLTDKRYVASINKSGYRYTPGVARNFLLSLDFRF